MEEENKEKEQAEEQKTEEEQPQEEEQKTEEEQPQEEEQKTEEEQPQETAEGTKDSYGRTLYKVKCADCGKDCEVPFKPDQDRPVYCRDCFRNHRPSRPKRF